MTTNTFTRDEILLAADRFLIEKNDQGAVVQLAQDFMKTGKHLSNITDCLSLVEEALQRGHKVNIEVPHGSSRVSPTPSP